MKNPVTITITGLAGSGKTTLMHVIAWALKLKGINVSCTDDGDKLSRKELKCPSKAAYDDRSVRIVIKERP